MKKLGCQIAPYASLFFYIFTYRDASFWEIEKNSVHIPDFVDAQGNPCETAVDIFIP